MNINFKTTVGLFLSLMLYNGIVLSYGLAPEQSEQTEIEQHQNIRIGSGDNKTGYESSDYVTDSRAIVGTRKGVKSDLMRVVDNPPLGLPKIPVPADNPITEDKIDLGRKLFFDRRLSINNTNSCATCHIPEQGFTNHELEKAVGVEGRLHRRNTPTIYNTAYYKRLFHDARERSLETLVWSPLLARNEMAMPAMGLVIDKIMAMPDYDGLFENAFDGRQADPITIGQALASYNRILVSGNSPFDRWYYAKEPNAISGQAIRGFALFSGKAKCILCHTMNENSTLFTDNKLHNVGLGFIRTMGVQPEKESMLVAPGLYVNIAKSFRDTVALTPLPDVGYYEITLDPADSWKYRTPTLRNVAHTAPYMHDGSMHDLKTVVEFYNKGGVTQNESGMPNDRLSPLIKPLGLSAPEIDAVVAFLNTLTGDNIAEVISDAYAVPIADVVVP